MQSPRHSPPPSAAAPRPKGILKNANERSTSSTSIPGANNAPSASSTDRVDEHGNRLVWDETNLTLHEIERENSAARMKIDEPKTPFVRSASLGSIGDDDGFDLDGSASLSADAGPSRTGASPDEVLAANTSANAGPRGSGAAAVGSDAMDLASSSAGPSTSAMEGEYQAPSARSTSRSPSFSLPPSSRRSSSASNRDARSGLREEMRARDQMDVDGGAGEVVGVDDEDDEDEDEETKAQKEAFAKKRNQHYGNEAEAMRIAKALAAQEDDEEEEDDEEGGGQQRSGGNAVPPVPPIPNGRS